MVFKNFNDDYFSAGKLSIGDKPNRCNFFYGYVIFNILLRVRIFCIINRIFQKIFKILDLVNIIICIFLLLIATSIIFKYGFVNFFERTTILRIYHPGWPNYFGIYLVLPLF
jgi:hypothetical protein